MLRRTLAAVAVIAAAGCAAAPSSHPTLVCIRGHESDRAGGYAAVNRKSGASGAYQFLDSTWRNVSARAGFPGYARAVHAPVGVQDAVTLWAIANRAGAGRPWRGTGCPGT